ncbi:MAG: flagellar basal body P-ring formation protein FlgA [Candidatus Obscuribacterales bacterium]|nr:flagellar basal body P-ring formation protein FlgA [Steroidobacteraceae bacterium]
MQITRLHLVRRVDIGIVAVRAILVAVVVLVIYSIFTTAAATATTQALASIRAAAEAHVRAAANNADDSIIATAGSLDPRLQLALCAGPLHAFTLHGATLNARNTIGVRCEQGAEWTVYLTVSIETDTKVLVLRSAAARDAHLAAADVDVQRRRVAGLGSTYIGDVQQLKLRHLKRSIPAGTALTVDMLSRDLQVKRGQQVVLVTSVQGIEVRANGLALTEGAESDRIRVQNASSLKVVEGVIESGNLVRVGM